MKLLDNSNEDMLRISSTKYYKQGFLKEILFPFFLIAKNKNIYKIKLHLCEDYPSKIINNYFIKL